MLLTLTLGLTGAFAFLAQSGSDQARRSAREVEPAVLVMPLEAAGDESSQLLASGLTNELITTLMRFDALQVFAGAPPGQGSAELPPAAAGARAYVVAGSVHRAPSRLRVTAHLTDQASKRLCHGKLDRRAEARWVRGSYAAAVAAFHCAAASARKRRSVRREIRWRCRLKVL